MSEIRWGIIGCGDVAEVKSGPGFQKAQGSSLTAVMRRDRAKAEDFAKRHGVPTVHSTARSLIDDPAVDAVYIATPPSSHRALALMTAACGKPCLVEKPMAMNHAECLEMIEAFSRAGVPLWVAYYRRALPRYLAVRAMLADGVIGRPTSAHIEIFEQLTTGEGAAHWVFDPAVAGAGPFLDLAGHCVDLLDFFLGPIAAAHGFALNTGGAYQAEDVTAAAFEFRDGAAATGIWNFNAAAKFDRLTLTGPLGRIAMRIFTDADVTVEVDGRTVVHPFRNPPHVHQPLIQTIVDELHGHGQCESTGETGARASWVMDRCIGGYYGKRF